MEASGRRASPPQRHSTWDVTQLSIKYPWIRVDGETIEDFHSLFEWVPAGDEDATTNPSVKSGSDAGSDDGNTQTKTIRKRCKRQRSPHRTQLRQSRKYEQRRQPGATTISPLEAQPSRSISSPSSPPTTRSEADSIPCTSPSTLPVMSPAMPCLPASVYADFHTLKQQQRQRQASLTKQRQKHQQAHSLLSLTLPALQKPARTVRAESLTSELNRLAHEQAELQRQVLATIDAEKAKLPLTFLFERNLDKAYCKQQSITTITSIFAKLQHRMLYHGFQRWLAWYHALLEDERHALAVQRAQRKALAFFERISSDAYVGTIGRAFTRWRATARAMAAEQMRAAAVKIQGLYRQCRARALLRDLKQASLDREYKRKHEIERLLRFESYGTAMKWNTLRNGFNLVLQSLCARRIQFFFRRIRTRKRIERRCHRNRAVITIQCQWRVYRAKQERTKLIKANAIRRERERVAAVHLQRQTRGYLARQHAALRRLQLSHESLVAGVVQRAWRHCCERGHLKQRFQRRRRLLDEGRARREGLQRIETARRDAAKREAMAVEIQRVGRGFISRHEARRRAEARRLDRAARRVQTSWRRSKGRYALHLRFVAQREKREARRCAAVLLLQCRVRIRRSRRIRDELLAERQRRRASAVHIQRVVRGRQAREVYAKTRRSTVTIQDAWRGKLVRQERERRRLQRELEEQQRYHATLKLQSVARGHRTRRFTRQLRREQQQMEELLRQSAVLIQKRARGMEARKTAALLKSAMQVVDKQQKRAFSASQRETPLLLFLAKQYFTKSQCRDGDNDLGEDGVVRYSRDQLEWIQWQIDAAIAQMKKEDDAILKLQHHYRGYATRMAFIVKLAQHRERKRHENRVVVHIQRVGRGFLVRRHVHKLRAKKRGDEIKEAYVRERKWKDQERAWQDQYKQEQMVLQLQRLQLLEKRIKDAKRDAEVAKWQAEAAAYRKQELLEQVEAAKLERALRRQQRGGDDDGDMKEEEEEEEEEADPAWQLVQDAYGNWYYFNQATGESSWEQPMLARSPKNKERTGNENGVVTESTATVKPPEPIQEDPKSPVTSTQAASEADASPASKTAVEPLPDSHCIKCRAAEADKECLDCVPDGASAARYCTACFAMEHTVISAKSSHDFKVLRCTESRSQCQNGGCPESGALASYFCGACDEGTRFSCERCFPRLHESAVASHHIPSALHFCRGALRCVECGEVLATRHCTQCDEAFCASCYGILHGQSKSSHEFTTLDIIKEDLTNEREAYCVDCDLKRCTKLCNLCGDGFCDACFLSAHGKGQKTSHTWLPWEQFASHGDWLEIQDTTSGRLVYFNIETKESTHTQPFVLKSGEERHRALFPEREAAMKSKALELESEIVKLKEQLQAIETEKEMEAQRKLRRRAQAEEQSQRATEEQSKAKKSGLFGGLFGSKKSKKAKPSSDAAKRSADEHKRLALQQSIAQSPSELTLIQSNLTTRERQQKELKAKTTVGTKQFEQAMLEQLVQPPAK